MISRKTDPVYFLNHVMAASRVESGSMCAEGTILIG